SRNIAVAPHLVDELASAGIRAEFVPSILDPSVAGAVPARWDGQVKPVLIYMPEQRKEFYGIEVTESVIAANPDIEFIVVADDSHSLSAHSNVESLGWVADMKSIYPRA